MTDAVCVRSGLIVSFTFIVGIYFKIGIDYKIKALLPDTKTNNHPLPSSLQSQSPTQTNETTQTM